LLLICGFAAWFLFTASAIYIETTPADADTRIASLMKLKLADRYLLRPGAYEAQITAPGYYPLSEEIRIDDAQNQHFSFQLRRLPGHLMVDTGAVSGAEVAIDGELKGKTPLRISEIPHGRRLVRISAERYFAHEQTVEIEGLDREQALQVDLVPAWADFVLKSDPQGAEVTVDDEIVGTTPLTTEILEGEHLIRIKLSGYKDWQQRRRIVAGEPVALDVTLDPADAVVFLVSNPARAATTVNGEYKGLTPLELALTPDEPATISLFKQGYQRASRKLTAKSGDQQRLTVKLQPKLATLEVQVEPRDANIYVDGVHKGSGAQKLQLTAMNHRIEVRKEGYVDHQSTVAMHSGIAQQLRVQLKTVAQAKQEAVKPLIRTADGQSLKLFYPGSVTMGASRREPGRRANETLRKVNLTRPFYLALHEVTNAAYKNFDPSHASGRIHSHTLQSETQPVVSITWEQAALYCNSLSQRDSLAPFYVVANGKLSGFNPSANGYRLPSEAEWAWAARVTGTGKLLKFPWGDSMPPPKDSGNFADEMAASIVGKVIFKYADGYAVTAPVGSYSPNSKGLFDMGGNVAEWTHDFYDITPSFDAAVGLDPLGPSTGEFHVIRGSSWAHGTITELRLSYRDYGNKARNDLGFRIARYLD